LVATRLHKIFHWLLILILVAPGNNTACNPTSCFLYALAKFINGLMSPESASLIAVK